MASRSSFQPVLIIGYYDGATHGVVECRKCLATYYFAMVWQETVNDDAGDVRVFAVAPIGEPGSVVRRNYLGPETSFGTFDMPGGDEGEKYLARLEALPPTFLVAARLIDHDILGRKLVPESGISSITNWRDWFGANW
jgi:hypothetical protein